MSARPKVDATIVVQKLRKQRPLSAIFAFDEALHLAPQ